MMDELELSDEEDQPIGVVCGGLQRHQGPTLAEQQPSSRSARQPSVTPEAGAPIRLSPIRSDPPAPGLPASSNDDRPSWAPSPSQASAPRRIPGPAGAISRASAAAQGATGPLLFSQCPRPNVSFFHRTRAWTELEALVSPTEGGVMAEVPHRMTLREAVREASAPPAVPLRVPVLCALIKAVGNKEGSGDDVQVTLADESGETEATFHGGIFNEHPGVLVTGAACALREVPVLSLAAHSHHLIVHPACVRCIVPPHQKPTPRPAAERPRGAARHQPRRGVRRGEHTVAFEPEGATPDSQKPLSPRSQLTRSPQRHSPLGTAAGRLDADSTAANGQQPRGHADGHAEGHADAASSPASIAAPPAASPAVSSALASHRDKRLPQLISAQHGSPPLSGSSPPPNGRMGDCERAPKSPRRLPERCSAEYDPADLTDVPGADATTHERDGCEEQPPRAWRHGSQDSSAQSSVGGPPAYLPPAPPALPRTSCRFMWGTAAQKPRQPLVGLQLGGALGNELVPAQPPVLQPALRIASGPASQPPAPFAPPQQGAQAPCPAPAPRIWQMSAQSAGVGSVDDLELDEDW